MLIHTLRNMSLIITCCYSLLLEIRPDLGELAGGFLYVHTDDEESETEDSDDEDSIEESNKDQKDFPIKNLAEAK